MKPVILITIKRLSFVFLFSGVAFLVLSCEDDLGSQVALLTMNIDPGYFPAGNDAWIFISDKIGRTIDVREVTDSTHVKFMGTERGAITLNILRQVAFANGDGTTSNSFLFDTYQEIASGSTINFKTATDSYEPRPEEIASVPFTLKDYDDSDRPQDALIFSDRTAAPYSVFDYDSYTYTGSNFSTQLNLRENPSNILITTYRDDVPVHQWLNDVKPGDEVAVSFDSFVPSKTISINKQIAQGSVKTIHGSNFSYGYIFTEYYSRIFSKSSNFQNLPKLGYLDGFEKYFVSVNLNQFHEKVNLSYTKVGDMPQSINLPDFTYSINNDDLYGLSVTFSNDYSLKQADFIGANSNSGAQVNWTLNASDVGNFRAPSIPLTIKTRYPMLNVDGLKLQIVAYTHYLDGYTYADYVRDRLGSTHTQRETYEELRYVFLQ